MTGATADLPIASLNPNLGSGRDLSHVPIPSGVPSQRSALDSPVDANGSGGLNQDQSTRNGSFLSNWQAMLASLNGSTGRVGETTALNPGMGEGSLQSLTAVLTGEGSMAGAGKGSAKADAPPASDAASNSSADRLARLQQARAFKSSPGPTAGDVTGASLSSISSRTSGVHSSRSLRGSDKSDSFNPARGFPDSISGLSLLIGGQTPANTALAVQIPAHHNDAFSAAAIRSSRQAASTADSGLLAHPPGIPGGNGKSIGDTASNLQTDGISEPSGSGSSALVPAENALLKSGPASESAIAGITSNSLNPLAESSSPLDSGSDAVWSGATPPVETASTSNVHEGKKTAFGPKISSDLTARSGQRSQRTSDVGIAARIEGHVSDLAQGNTASSNLSNAGFPLAISGACSGSSTGATLGSVTGTSSSASLASRREPFAALDGESPAGSFSWTHIGANRAEAGYEDPTLGWIGVRADLGGGGVHASLVPGSADAAQTLGSQLAGLNHYLAERHPGFGPVTVAAQDNGAIFANAHSDHGNESGAHSGSQSFTQQDAPANSDAIQSVGIGESIPSKARSMPVNLAAEPTLRSNGSYISVMA